MAKTENHWEIVHDIRGERTDRLAIPGGWLYRTHIIPWSEDAASAIAMVFVPNPKPGTKTA